MSVFDGLLCKEAFGFLVAHCAAVAAAIAFNFWTSFYRATNCKVSYASKFFINITKQRNIEQIKHIIRIMRSTREEEYVVNFTNYVVETEEGERLNFLERNGMVGQMRDGRYYTHDSDGNYVESRPELIFTKNAEELVDEGKKLLESDVECNTICGSYERKNALAVKQLLILLSNLSVATFMWIARKSISKTTSPLWSTALSDISAVIVVVTLVFTAVVVVQYLCLLSCVTTQMLVEAVSKLGTKVVYISRDKEFTGEGDAISNIGDVVECWHATSIFVADVVVRSKESGKRMYTVVQGEMASKQMQCKYLKKDIESSMYSVSTNAYKLAGSNLTGIIVFFAAVHSATPDSFIDGLFVVFVGLLLVSVWCTLVVAGELVKYASFLNQLKNLTVSINFVGMHLGNSAYADNLNNTHGSATLNQYVVWTAMNDTHSNSNLRMRSVASRATISSENQHTDSATTSNEETSDSASQRAEQPNIKRRLEKFFENVDLMQARGDTSTITKNTNQDLMIGRYGRGTKWKNWTVPSKSFLENLNGNPQYIAINGYDIKKYFPGKYMKVLNMEGDECVVSIANSRVSNSVSTNSIPEGVYIVGASTLVD